MSMPANVSVQFNAAGNGAGDFVVASAVSGFLTPEQAAAIDGKTYAYVARSADGSAWEFGSGTYAYASHTLARTTISSTSSGDTSAPVNFAQPPVVTVFPSPAATLEPPPATVVRYDVAQAQTAAQRAQARANIGAQKKNYILNGAMMVSQENGTTSGTASGYYPVDMFAQLCSNTGVQMAQQIASPTPGGSPNRLRVTCSSVDAAVAAGDYLMLRTAIEGSRAADLQFGTGSAKQIILQFGVRAPAGTYCVAMRNAALNRSRVEEYTIAASEAYTDVVKAVVLTGDLTGTWAQDNTVGIEVVWTLMCGTGSQTAAGAWTAGSFIASPNQTNFMGTLGNIFEMFDVQLCEGPAAPDFAVPDYPSQLLACQRYFMIWRDTDLFSGATAEAGGNQATYPLWYPVAMRAKPTATGPTWNYHNGSWIAGTTQYTTTTSLVLVSVAVGTNSGGWLIQMPAGNSLKLNARL
jgi:hypothetical protein